MHDYVNARVKNREWYRPLSPIVLQEEVSTFFELDRPSPFMLIITDVKAEKRALIKEEAASRYSRVARICRTSESVLRLELWQTT